MSFFSTERKEKILDIIKENPEMVPVVILTTCIICILVIIAYILITFLFLKINKKIFNTLEKKHGKQISLQFAQYIINLVIVVVFVLVPLAGDEIKQSALGSAAVIGAVIGFAGQDIIRDVLSGLLISVYKPFNIGDRIELDDGKAGVVETITLRHVVLIGLDSARFIVPNSKMNGVTVKNMSYENTPRSCEFLFPVGYNTDVAKAKDVILKAIQDSPYTIPGKKNKQGDDTYGPVYFIALADSAYNMKTTVYFESCYATEMVRDDINTRVCTALGNAGITIPYPYTNVVMQKE